MKHFKTNTTSENPAQQERISTILIKNKKELEEVSLIENKRNTP